MKKSRKNILWTVQTLDGDVWLTFSNGEQRFKTSMTADTATQMGQALLNGAKNPGYKGGTKEAAEILSKMDESVEVEPELQSAPFVPAQPESKPN